MTDETADAGEAAALWLDGLLGHDGIANLAKGVRRELESGLKGAFKIKAPSLLGAELARRLAGELHVDVVGFLADGWNAATELDDCRKSSRADPAATVVAALGRHSISRDLKPAIVVTWAGSKSFDIDAAIALEGVFEGVELAFRAGRLVSVGSGHCDIAVRLKLAGRPVGHALVKRRWPLPGEYRLRREATAPTHPES